MIISFTNVIGAIQSLIKRVITDNLKMWLGFETSETLGREEVVNGDFSDGTTGWLPNDWTISNNVAASGNTSSLLQQTNVFINSTGVYKSTFKARSVNGTNETLRFYDGLNEYETFTITSSDFQDFTLTRQRAGDDSTLYIFNNLDAEIEITNISVKELTQITPDKSGNNNVGELFTGKALEFDGAGDYVDISGFTMSGNVSTFAFWINSNDTLGRMIDIDTNRFVISFENNQLSLYDGSWKNFGTISTNVWNRCVIVTNGTSAKCYVNGVQLGVEKTITAINISSATAAIIGASYQHIHTFFNGEMSDFQIYNSAWTQADVTYDYANPNKLAIDNPSTSLNVTNLKAYWALSEGDGLVAYDSGTNLEEEEVQNGTFNLGSEEVVNGDFATDSDWTKENGWSIANGLATRTNVGSYTALQQNVLESGKVYQVTFTIDSVTSGEIFGIRLGTNYILSNKSTEETFTGVGVANATTLSIMGNPTFAGSISNISVKEVPNWELLNGATISDNKANIIGDGSSFTSIKQVNVFENNKRYKITADVTITSGLGLKFQDGANNENIGFATTTGVYTFYFTGTSDADLVVGRRTSGTAFDSSVNNISVREVTASDHGGLVNGATYVDAQPRIPQLGMMNWSKGSNLFPYSEDFTEWIINSGTSQAVLAASEAAPYGQGDVYSIIMQASESDAYIRYATTNATLTSSTHSVWVKQAPTGSATHIRITNNNRAAWNTGTSQKIALTSNWQRLETTDAISGNRFTLIGSADASGTQDSDCLGKALIYGAQLVEGSSAGVYRFTDGAATLNSTVIANPTTPTKDIFGNAVRDRLNSFNLDGSGYAANETLPTISGNISLSFWVKLDTFVSGNLGQVLGKREGSSWLRVYRPYASHLRLEVAAGQQYTFPVTENQWVYVAITINSSNQASVYVDDSAVSGATLGTSFSFINTEVFTVGAWLNPALQSTSKLNGLVSDVLIYDRVLTVEEVENNYNAGLSAHTNN